MADFDLKTAQGRPVEMPGVDPEELDAKLKKVADSAVESLRKRYQLEEE